MTPNDTIALNVSIVVTALFLFALTYGVLIVRDRRSQARIKQLNEQLGYGRTQQKEIVAELRGETRR